MVFSCSKGASAIKLRLNQIPEHFPGQLHEPAGKEKSFMLTYFKESNASRVVRTKLMQKTGQRF
jgi:hypothetical protein